MSILREWAHSFRWLVRHLTHRLPESEADRLRHYLPETCVCVDLGANAGSWTVPLSRIVPRGQVVAFEALPYYASVLRRTLRFLGCRNVEVVNQAVCETEQSVSLVWKDSHGKRLTGLTHILGPRESAAGTSITVSGTTLDSYFSSRPGTIRFMKMDIEGAEFAALRGAERLLTQHRPVVYTELNASHCARYGYVPADVFEFFGRQQYQGFIPDIGNKLESVDVERYIESQKQNVWFVPQEEVAAFTKSASP